jgi:hypothetical protein
VEAALENGRYALAQLMGYIEGNRTQIRGHEPWHRWLAVGAGAVEGVCKHIIQSRFQRTGMLWKLPGVLNVLALRLARLNRPPRHAGLAADSRSRHRHHPQNEGTPPCYIECELFDNSSV